MVTELKWKSRNKFRKEKAAFMHVSAVGCNCQVKLHVTASSTPTHMLAYPVKSRW